MTIPSRCHGRTCASTSTTNTCSYLWCRRRRQKSTHLGGSVLTVAYKFDLPSTFTFTFTFTFSFHFRFFLLPTPLLLFALASSSTAPLICTTARLYTYQSSSSFPMPSSFPTSSSFSLPQALSFLPTPSRSYRAGALLLPLSRATYRARLPFFTPGILRLSDGRQQSRLLVYRAHASAAG